VTVDLSDLGFADVTLMIDLALLARRLRARGRAMMLRGAQPQVRRMIEALGIHRLPGVTLDGPAPAVV
jgi:anti-anti-sigma regulatory factor